MEYSPILVPVVALVAWSLVVMLWMAATRLPAMWKAGMPLHKVPAGARGVDLEGRVPPSIMWKSHNYTHLMEQPTLFYAIAVTLALMGMGGGFNCWLAWSYVGLRVIHSLFQATVNIVLIRFTLFVLSSLCLVGLTLHAVFRIVGDMR